MTEHVSHLVAIYLWAVYKSERHRLVAHPSSKYTILIYFGLSAARMTISLVMQCAIIMGIIRGQCRRETLNRRSTKTRVEIDLVDSSYSHIP